MRKGAETAPRTVTKPPVGRSPICMTGDDLRRGSTMRNEHVTIRSLAVFDLLAQQADAMPVRVELRYDSRDPYAVHAVFQTGRTDAADVEWVFARDLFADGLLTEAGAGGVR